MKIPGLFLFTAALLGGCRGTPTPAEEAARRDLASAERSYRPEGGLPSLPKLTASSPVTDFVRYAIRRHPKIEQRFFAWKQSVEEITLARSLPDPSLTLEIELSRMDQAVMPGLLASAPGPGKLVLAAEAQSQAAAARRFEFEQEVAATAARAWISWLDAAFLQEAVRIDREVLSLVRDELEAIVKTQFGVGKVSQQDLLRVEIEREQLQNDLVSLEDSHAALVARLRASLGIPIEEPEPPFPVGLPAEPASLPTGDLVTEVLANNRELRAMEAEIRQAESLAALARKSAQPDFMAGLKVNVLSPTIVTPELSMTLPIWLDKIEAAIAATEAMRAASGSRLAAARLEQVMRLAEATFAHRDARRRLILVREQLLPRAVQALDIAKTSYATGRTDLTGLLDAERSVLAFRREEARGRQEMDAAIAQVSYELLARSGAEAQ